MAQTSIFDFCRSSNGATEIVSCITFVLEDSQGQTIVYGDDGFSRSGLVGDIFDSFFRLHIYMRWRAKVPEWVDLQCRVRSSERFK